MQFSRALRADPEKIFMVFKNSYDTASLTNGQACMVDYTDDADGVGVTKPAARSTTHNGNVIAGIAAATIAAGKCGLIQVYGYHSAVRARIATQGATLAAGKPLYCAAAGAFCVEPARFVCTTCSSTTKVSVLEPIGFSLGSAYTLWTTTTIAAFIKAL